MKTAVGCLVKGVASLLVLVIITMINVESNSPSGILYIIGFAVIGAIWFGKWAMNNETSSANVPEQEPIIPKPSPPKPKDNEPPLPPKLLK